MGVVCVREIFVCVRCVYVFYINSSVFFRNNNYSNVNTISCSLIYESAPLM